MLAQGRPHAYDKPTGADAPFEHKAAVQRTAKEIADTASARRGGLAQELATIIEKSAMASESARPRPSMPAMARALLLRKERHKLSVSARVSFGRSMNMNTHMSRTV